jgi:hypothetical protein
MDMARRLVLRMGFSHFLVAANLLIQPQAFRSPSGVLLRWLLEPLQAFLHLAHLPAFKAKQMRQFLVAHGPDAVRVG